MPNISRHGDTLKAKQIFLIPEFISTLSGFLYWQPNKQVQYLETISCAAINTKFQAITFKRTVSKLISLFFE